LGLSALLARDHEINSSLALGDKGFGPKRFAECLIASIAGITAAIPWLTALAREFGGRKNLPEAV